MDREEVSHAVVGQARLHRYLGKGGDAGVHRDRDVTAIGDAPQPRVGAAPERESRVDRQVTWERRDRLEVAARVVQTRSTAPAATPVRQDSPHPLADGGHVGDEPGTHVDQVIRGVTGGLDTRRGQDRRAEGGIDRPLDRRALGCGVEVRPLNEEDPALHLVQRDQACFAIQHRPPVNPARPRPL